MITKFTADQEEPLLGERKGLIAAAGYELVVSDGGALNSAPDQISIQTVGQVAAIEPVGPLPRVAREVPWR